MAYFRCDSGGGTAETLQLHFYLPNSAQSYYSYLKLTSNDVETLNSMGYYYVKTNATSKQAISTNRVTISWVDIYSPVTATVTFSKT